MRRPRLGLPALCVAIALSGAACSGGEGGAGSTASTDSATSPSASASTGPDPSPSVEPAWPDGRVVDLEVATLRVPRSWTLKPLLAKNYYDVRPDRLGLYSVQVGALPLFGDLDETDEVELSLEEIEKETRRRVKALGRDLRILERREVNGVLMGQWTYTTATGKPVYELSAEYEDKQMVLTFRGRRGELPHEDERTEQLLSTLEWGEDQA